MTKKIILFLAVTLAMALTSCMDTKDTGTKNTLRYASDRYFLHVVDRTTGNVTNSTGATTEFVILLKSNSMSISIKAENWVIGDRTVSFNVPDTEFKVSASGGVSLKSGQIITNEGLTLENVDLEIVYPMSQEPYTWTRMSFTFGNYSVNFVQSNIYFYGTTVSQAANPPYTTKDVAYGVALNPATMKAGVYIANAKFMENMPAQNISLVDLPLVINNGSFSISATDVVPKIGSTPFPKYTMPTFDFNGSFDGSASCRFTCSEENWAVSATLSTVMPSQNNNNGTTAN